MRSRTGLSSVAEGVKRDKCAGESARGRQTGYLARLLSGAEKTERAFLTRLGRILALFVQILALR